MSGIEIVGTPEEAGLDPSRWNRVEQLASGWCSTQEVPAIGLVVCRNGRSTGVKLYGQQTPDESAPVIRDDAVFLVASITKPIVAMAAMLLVERGQLTLSERVSRHLESFSVKGKHGIRIRHLLTHTSGLPDMLTNNQQLRENHRGLDEFVTGTAEAEMSFVPGRGVQYQSMGFAVLAAIIEKVAGKPCNEFVREEICEPLGLSSTFLGVPDDWFDSGEADRIAGIRLPYIQQGTDWGWNSRYWRQLGAPWGGLLTTPWELAVFAQSLLSSLQSGIESSSPHPRIFSRATVEAATRNQLQQMHEVPEIDRRCRPWGFGWRLQWPAHSANFGDLLGPRTFGHWGATGTALWIDPDRDALAVILTTEPQEPHGRYLSRLSNAIAASLI